MEGVEIAPNVFWVGAIDWKVRDFHGYHTPRGSTYNAYLILDEKVTLIDTVKAPLFEELKARISHYVDPAKIEVVISNHAEMDHSSGLPLLMELVPQAPVYCSERGEAALRRHYGKDLDFHTVETGDTLSLGKRSLKFILTPMLHWPDSMMTYLPEEQVLFSMDAFGQHVASTERFEEELGVETALLEARTYWANILMPLGKMAAKAFEDLGDTPIKTICPSHGVVWRRHIPRILDAYWRWATHRVGRKAVIVYATMWQSTEKMAQAIAEGLRGAGVETHLFDLGRSDLTWVMSELQEAAAIVVGSSTLNMTALPKVGEFLTYLGGLKPEGRVGAIFGSYGWSRGAEAPIRKTFETIKADLPLRDLLVQYVPSAEDLNNCQSLGRQLAQAIDQRVAK